VDPLIPVLKHLSPVVRQCAAEALGGIRHIRSVPFLMEALGDEELGVRWAAAMALGNIGRTLREDDDMRTQIITALFSVLADSQFPVYGAAMEAYLKLRATEQEYVTAYLRAYDSVNVEVRRDVVAKLWRLGVDYPNVMENVIASLLHILSSDSSPEIFKDSISALKVLDAGDDVLIGGITTAFSNASVDIRMAGIEELIELGSRDNRVVEALTSCLSDPIRTVRKAARKAFERLNIRFPYRPESTISTEVTYLNNIDPGVRIQAASAILRMSEIEEYWRQAVDSVVEIAVDPIYADVRAAGDNEKIVSDAIQALNGSFTRYESPEDTPPAFMRVVSAGISELRGEPVRTITTFMMTANLREIRDRILALFGQTDDNGAAVVGDPYLATVKAAYEGGYVDENTISVIVQHVPEFGGLSASEQKIVVDSVYSARQGGTGEVELPEPERDRPLPSAGAFLRPGAGMPAVRGTRAPPPVGPEAPAQAPSDIERMYNALKGLVTTHLEAIEGKKQLYDGLHMNPKTPREFVDEKSNVKPLSKIKIGPILGGIILLALSFSYYRYEILPMSFLFAAVLIAAFLIGSGISKRGVRDITTFFERLKEQDKVIKAIRDYLAGTKDSMVRSYYFDRMDGNSSLLIDLMETIGNIRDREWDREALLRLIGELDTRSQAVEADFGNIDVGLDPDVTQEDRDIMEEAAETVTTLHEKGRAPIVTVPLDENLKQVIYGVMDLFDKDDRSGKPLIDDELLEKIKDDCRDSGVVNESLASVIVDKVGGFTTLGTPEKKAVIFAVYNMRTLPAGKVQPYKALFLYKISKIKEFLNPDEVDNLVRDRRKIQSATGKMMGDLVVDRREKAVANLTALEIVSSHVADDIRGLDLVERRNLDAVDLYKVTENMSAEQLKELLLLNSNGKRSFAVHEGTPERDINDINSPSDLRRIIEREQGITGVIYRHRMMPVIDAALKDLVVLSNRRHNPNFNIVANLTSSFVFKLDGMFKWIEDALNTGAEYKHKPGKQSGIRRLGKWFLKMAVITGVILLIGTATGLAESSISGMLLAGNRNYIFVSLIIVGAVAAVAWLFSWGVRKMVPRDLDKQV
ncbi:MAG: HEAT repeat domain-containing protein, partial [Candidatus Omnitrophota bacterium]